MQLAQGLYAYPWTQMTVNNCNSYALSSPPTALVDPGHAQLYGHVETGLSEDGLGEIPELVVATHCHPDHIEAALDLQKKGARLAMHPVEAQYMEGEGRQLAASFGLNFPEVTVDLFLEEGEFSVGDLEVRVLHTPGHSPGHVCLYLPQYKTLVAGDLVFAQGVGRVDFPGGDGKLLKDSISKVAELEIEMLLPGHGPAIKGAEQVAKNFEYIKQMYFPMF